MATSKSLPLLWADTDADSLAAHPRNLTDFPTPLVTLSEVALQHNIDTMAAWCTDAGVGLAPHGKTTMSRELWRRQVDAGAWGITVATPWQLSVALGWGIPRVMLANALVQPAALRFVAQAPSDQRVVVWADSLRTVEIMEQTLALAGASRPLDVLVELGATGGRTGARVPETALAIARAVAESPALRLVGVSGYEGALAHTADEHALATVRAYLVDLRGLFEAILAEGLLADLNEPAILTAGGSAYFDVVAEELAPCASDRVEVLLRSGAYITHDEGYYEGISPLGRTGDSTFRSAIHGWATVVSRPEPGLAVLDAGKRDFPYDEGLPQPQRVRRFGGTATESLTGATVAALNDQHAFVEFPADVALEVGDVVRFGLSHPCTTFDKWQVLPVVDDVDAAEPRVTNLIETTFG